MLHLFYSIKAVGQIVEHIVINPCVNHSKKRGNKQHRRNNKNNDPAFYNISYGEDVFLYDLENVEIISEEEFRRIQDELYTRGETVFYTSDAFI